MELEARVELREATYRTSRYSTDINIEVNGRAARAWVWSLRRRCRCPCSGRWAAIRTRAPRVHTASGPPGTW
eukprot:935809-Prymnesium_polylepis.1